MSLVVFAVISEHFSKNRMIMSAMAAKLWYLKMFGFIGLPCSLDVSLYLWLGKC